MCDFCNGYIHLIEKTTEGDFCRECNLHPEAVKIQGMSSGLCLACARKFIMEGNASSLKNKKDDLLQKFKEKLGELFNPIELLELEDK